MTRSHATGWASDAPTPAQMKELFDQIDSGRVTGTRLQMLLGNQPTPSTVHVSGEYPVIVHHGPDAITRHLQQGFPLQKNHYGVSDECYPQGDRTFISPLNVRLIYFGRCIGTAEALREFDRLGFEAAPPTAVLGLGNYKHLFQRLNRVVSLAQFHHTAYYSHRPREKEDLAVAVQLEGNTLEAWAFPEGVWKNEDSEVRFAVVAKKN